MDPLPSISIPIFDTKDLAVRRHLFFYLPHHLLKHHSSPLFDIDSTVIMSALDKLLKYAVLTCVFLFAVMCFLIGVDLAHVTSEACCLGHATMPFCGAMAIGCFFFMTVIPAGAIFIMGSVVLELFDEVEQHNKAE